MRVLLYGPVTVEHLADAALFMGIEPTSFLTNGEFPAPLALPVEVIHPSPMLEPPAAIAQANWHAVIRADAAVMTRANSQLTDWVASCDEQFRIPVFEA